MGKKKAILILLPLIALLAVSSMNVNAQKGGNSGGKRGGGCTPSVTDSQRYDPTTGIYTQIVYAVCNGAPVSGYHVTWWAFTPTTECFITTTGAMCIGSTLSVQLYTDSMGYAQTSFLLSAGLSSWGISGY